jgi:uncharacterized damage-inducible protein DinB
MNWSEMLKSELESAYRATVCLMNLVDDDDLDWKPETGKNWMTTGQLLKHMTTACGRTTQGFVTGDWGLPDGQDMNDMPPDEMLPPAARMPTVSGLSEAKRLLQDDKMVALQMIDKAGEKRLATEPCPAPWDPTPMPLGQRVLSMVNHLNNHKGQLYYYLKLQGKDVNTMHYYGLV